MTLAISIVFSAFLALTLTPALYASFLKQNDDKNAKQNWFNKTLGGFDSWFNNTSERYGNVTRSALGVTKAMLVAFLLLVALTIFLFMRLPGGFLPTEDQGYAITAVPPLQEQPGREPTRHCSPSRTFGLHRTRWITK